MKYCVGRGVLADSFLDISADDFQNLEAAKRNLLVLLGIEEKYEMLMDNYLEYESSVLALALADMASRTVTWSWFHDAMRLVTRRLANCLTVGRLYEDSMTHDLSIVYGRKADITTQIAGAFEMQRARLLGYRAMQQIRNCLQHRALPLKELACRAAWEEHKDRHIRHHCVTTQLDVQELRADRNIDRRFIGEMEQSDGANDITFLLRQYIEGLSCVHEELRAATNLHIEEWKSTLRQIMRRYSEACAEDISIVVAFRLDDEDAIIEEVYVVRDVIDRLERTRTKPALTNISRRYVSNAPL